MLKKEIINRQAVNSVQNCKKSPIIMGTSTGIYADNGYDFAAFCILCFAYRTGAHPSTLPFIRHNHHSSSPQVAEAEAYFTKTKTK